MEKCSRKFNWKKILTKEFLIEQYINLRKPMQDIADEFRCSAETIRRYLIMHNIPIRTKSEAKKGRKCKPFTKEHKEKMSKSAKNKPLMTEQTHQKMCKAKKGEKNPMYGIHPTKETLKKMSLGLGGTGIPYENNDYSADFNKELKEKIRKRDNYTCQICGMTEEEHIIVYGKVLSVHHIDYDKQNSIMENTTSLCSPCHIRTNYNCKYWEGYFQKIGGKI